MRQLEIALDREDVDIKDIATVFLALQRQNFVLGNSLTNLIKQWTIIEEEAWKSGHSLENKS